VAARGLVALLVVAFVAAAAACAAADDFADFRIPENRVLLWTGSVKSSANWDRYGDPISANRSGSEGANLGTSLLYRRETDARTTTLGVSTSLTGNRSHQLADEVIAATSHSLETTERSTLESFQLGLGNAWYPTRPPLAIVTDVAFDLSDSQDWQAQHEVFVAPPGGYLEQWIERTSWQYGNLESGSLGAGVGRVRNATGVYEAEVLEQRLKASGVLARALSPEGRRALAALMYARGDYSTELDRPAAAVWEAIERILARDGALADSALAPAALMRAIEPYIGRASGLAADGLPRSPVVRLRGWLATVQVAGSSTHEVGRYHEQVSARTAPGGPDSFAEFGYRSPGSSDQGSWGVVLEGHQPVGGHWQFDLASSVMLPLLRHHIGFTEQSGASVACLVTDRWLVRASISDVRIVDSNSAGYTYQDSWNVDYGGTLEYWVNDHVDAQLGVQQHHDRYRADAIYGLPPSSEEKGGLTLGLTYRFAGFAEIPGIFPATP